MAPLRLRDRLDAPGVKMSSGNPKGEIEWCTALPDHVSQSLKVAYMYLRYILDFMFCQHEVRVSSKEFAWARTIQ